MQRWGRHVALWGVVLTVVLVMNVAWAQAPARGKLERLVVAVAPLGWDTGDARPVAGAIAFLFSDLSKGITGELLHVDGGFNAMGTEPGGPTDAGD